MRVPAVRTEDMKNTAGAKKTYSLGCGLSAKRCTLVFLPLTLSSVGDSKKGGKNSSGENSYAASCQSDV